MKQKNKEILYNISTQDVTYILNNGFHWFKDTILYNIKKSDIDNTSLSDLWYLIGDVYDMTDAPLKALESYKRAITIDNTNYAAYREAASKLEAIGQYTEAFQYINKSLEIEPDDECSISDKRSIENNIRFNNEPLFTQGDLLWDMNEYLANQKFGLIIKELRNSSDIEFLKILARSYAALEKIDEYTDIWNSIASSFTNFELGYGDWFYISDKIYNHKKFWNLIKDINNFIKPSVFINYNSFDQNYPDINMKEKRRIFCDFHLFRIDNDTKRLNELKERFPKWEELKNISND